MARARRARARTPPRALEAGMTDQGVDLVGERGADDRLAVAGAGDRDGHVVGPGAGGDQRRVADAARVLAGGSRRSRSRRRRRRARRARRRRPSPRAGARFWPVRNQSSGPALEPHGRARTLRPSRPRASRGAPRRARRGPPDRVPDPAQRSDGACRAIGAAHDRGVMDRRPRSSSAAPRPALNTGSSSSTTPPPAPRRARPRPREHRVPGLRGRARRLRARPRGALASSCPRRRGRRS